MSVLIDAGSTQFACARHLAGRTNLTITTNPLDIALDLSTSPGLRLRVAPGIVRRTDNAISGQETCRYIERFAFDIALVGIGTYDNAMVWMDFEEDESILRRLVAPRAKRLVVLADSSKFGKRASIQTYPLSQPLTVATDRRPEPAFFQAFRKSGIEVLFPGSKRVRRDA